MPDAVLRRGRGVDGGATPDVAGPPRELTPRVHDALDVASLFAGVALFTVLVAGGTSVLRAVTGVAFTVFVPGWAVLSNVAILRRTHAGLAVVLSLALLALVATVTLWARAWHPLGVAEVECAAASGVLVLSLVRRGRRRRRPER